MKAFKIISLIFISIFLCFSFAALFTGLAIRNTYFSSAFFNEIYDKSNVNDAFNNMLFKEMKLDDGLVNVSNLSDNSAVTELKKSINEIELSTITDLDNNWIKKEIPNVSKGYFGYFFGDKKELYLIDFKTPKDILKEMTAKMIEKFISNIDISNRLDTYIEKVNKGLENESKLKISREKTVDLLMNDSLVKDMNISKSEVSQIIEKMNNANSQKLSKEVIYKEITAIIFSDEIKFDTIKDTMDLNAILDKQFGSTQNPFRAVKTFLAGIKIQTLWFPFIIVALLLLLIWVITFRLFRFLRWVGINLIGASLILFVMNPLVVYGIYEGFEQEIKDNNILYNAVCEFISKPFTVSLIIGIISMFAGIFLIVFSASKKKHYNSEIKTNPEKIKVARILSAIILMILLPIMVFVNTIFIVNSANKMNEIVKSFQDKGGLNMNKILAEDMGWDFSAK